MARRKRTSKRRSRTLLPLRYPQDDRSARPLFRALFVFEVKKWSRDAFLHPGSRQETEWSGLDIELWGAAAAFSLLCVATRGPAIYVGVGRAVT